MILPLSGVVVKFVRKFAAFGESAFFQDALAANIGLIEASPDTVEVLFGKADVQCGSDRLGGKAVIPVFTIPDEITDVSAVVVAIDRPDLKVSNVLAGVIFDDRQQQVVGVARHPQDEVTDGVHGLRIPAHFEVLIDLRVIQPAEIHGPNVSRSDTTQADAFASIDHSDTIGE